MDAVADVREVTTRNPWWPRTVACTAGTEPQQRQRQQRQRQNGPTADAPDGSCGAGTGMWIRSGSGFRR
ncbi:hypothetical protein [Kitasatospora sp. DSM 101779]|uniref:hypothetical protein n=1 Tax=Kitasatospora sp. DSM 101779 TaxID=2853165 RepID=UPI0021DB7277|nr:hypothetical protein [Kitasatospora sp. DSM 101779]MCU7820801.1 hypothetical protein [Kitasatospora sp. DSM 101779]